MSFETKMLLVDSDLLESYWHVYILQYVYDNLNLFCMSLTLNDDNLNRVCFGQV